MRLVTWLNQFGRSILHHLRAITEGQPSRSPLLNRMYMLGYRIISYKCFPLLMLTLHTGTLNQNEESKLLFHTFLNYCYIELKTFHYVGQP